MEVTSVTLLLFLLASASAWSKSLHTSATALSFNLSFYNKPGHHHQLSTELPFCASVQSLLQKRPRAASRLRDVLQLIQQSNITASGQHGLADSTASRHLHEEHEDTLHGWQVSSQNHTVQQDIVKHVRRAEQLVHLLVSGGALPQGTTTDKLSSCLMARLNPRLYPQRPQVSFLLQYFRRPWMVGPLVSALRSCSEVTTQLLVNVDDTQEGEEGASLWLSAASSTGGWVLPVLSSNLHEVRAYNRLAHLASGRLLVLLQDDEVPPSGCGWLQHLLALFERWPLLGAVGMRVYNMNTRPDNRIKDREVYFRDPSTNISMQFVQLVDFAPLAVRRTAFHHVGGLDEGLSDPGRCGVYSDFELSYRLWRAGWQVAFYPLNGTSADKTAPGGTHRKGAKLICWQRQMEMSARTFQLRWMVPHVGLRAEVGEWIRSLNLRVLGRHGDKPCPYSDDFGGCDPSKGMFAGASISNSGGFSKGVSLL